MPLASRLRRGLRAVRKHSEDNEAAYSIVFSFLELILIGIGIYLTVNQLGITVSALRENTNANRTASRSQLYASENEILAREFETADSPVASIYSLPDSSVIDPKEYVRQRLQVISSDKAVLDAKDVDELYETFYGLQSFGKENRPDIVNLRKVYIHLTAILDQMHAAVDYRRDDVVSEGELDTWLGYTVDIG